MQFQANPVRLNRQKLHWALCVPTSCTSRDVEISLRDNLEPVFSMYGINLTVRVDETFCRAHQTTIYPQAYFIARYKYGLAGIENLDFSHMYSLVIFHEFPRFLGHFLF